MTITKRITGVLAVAVLVLGLVGCTSEPEGPTSDASVATPGPTADPSRVQANREELSRLSESGALPKTLSADEIDALGEQMAQTAAFGKAYEREEISEEAMDSQLEQTAQLFHAVLGMSFEEFLWSPSP